VTLATRVRIEILKALSNRVTNSQQLAYCTYNGPRPKLSVGPTTGFPGRRSALHFAPAIKKYGYLLEEAFLDKAYSRAQMFFSGGGSKITLLTRHEIYVHELFRRTRENLSGPERKGRLAPFEGP
jgi:hypothetical protein